MELKSGKWDWVQLWAAYTNKRRPLSSFQCHIPKPLFPNSNLLICQNNTVDQLNPWVPPMWGGTGKGRRKNDKAGLILLYKSRASRLLGLHRSLANPLQSKMEARSKSSSAPVLPLSFSLHRSHSPTRHFNSPSSSSAFNFAVHRTLSPTRASFSGASSYSSSVSTAASSSINLGLDRSTSQVRGARFPISPKGGAAMKSIPCAPPRKTCMCSPTNHPGSFRCSLHRNSNNSSSSTMQSHLNARRSAMTNSVVRIGGVEGEWVRRALTALIRPSSHHMRRRSSFQPRPSRLCHMTTAQDVS